ncbi:hypothetical protein [Methylocystis rosea]|uniref:hypothetical protein n=1 Tax=Methylocystis rosea TaxID=173366 RepID=UPI00037E8DEB|nr:hypothetical protein [Methylocystis rosea]
MSYTEFRNRLVDVIADQGTSTLDRYDFTTLDLLIGELRRQGEPVLGTLEEALLSIVPGLALSDPNPWRAIRAIAKQTDLHSPPLSEALEKLLDDTTIASDPMARYWILRTIVDLGGLLTIKSLSKEEGLKTQAPGLWLDLARVALVGAPRELTSLYIDAIQYHGLAWSEVRKRIPDLMKALGNEHFVLGMKKILGAIQADDERKSLAIAIEAYSGVNIRNAMHEDSPRAPEESSEARKVATFRLGGPVQRAILKQAQFRQQRNCCPAQIVA